MLQAMETLMAEYEMFPRESTVVCAVSGGADSVCLLHRLCRLRASLGIRVIAAHYNHNLRGEESQRDEEFVRSFAQTFCGLTDGEIVVGQGDVAGAAKAAGKGLEETAREMRYAFLEAAAARTGAKVIAVAHNANDNAETILLHLIRGSGLRGLTGMAAVRGKLVRPLLTTSREEIEGYLREHALPCVEDSTNADQTYTRNRIRRSVLPMLEDICPGAMVRLNQTAGLLQMDEEYLSGQAKLLVQQARGDDRRIEIPAQLIAQAHPALASRAARILIGRLREGNDNCTAAHLRAVLDAAASPRPSASVNLPGGVTVGREYDQLIFATQTCEPLAEQIPLAMPGETRAGTYLVTCQLAQYEGEGMEPFCFWLSEEKAGQITLRRRKTGDRLTRPGRPGKSVKKLLIDEKIPRQDRDALPVFEANGQAAAVAGLGPDAGFLPAKGERGWKITISSGGNC